MDEPIKRLSGVDVLARPEESQVQATKPEIDLQSLTALGSNAAPSRTDRQPKRTWRRKS
jgi:hypothetical protein